MYIHKRKTRPARGTHRGRPGKSIPLWLLVLACVAIGSGAAMGTVLAGEINGIVPVAVSQSILVDSLALGVDDITYSDGTFLNRAFAATADDDTAFQVATEIAVGDKFIISLPLRNASDNPLIGLITLQQCEPDDMQLDVDEHSLLALTHVTAPPEDAAARGAPLGVTPPGTTHTYQTRYWPLADANDDGVVDASDIIPAVTGIGASVSVDSVNALMGEITYTIAGAAAASLTVDYWYGSEITMLAQVGPCQWKFQADASVGTNKSGDVEIIVAHPDGSAPNYYRIKGTIEQIRF
jgi:hypothetical protein